MIGQFKKKVGIGWDPPPSLGQIPNFGQKFVLQASLIQNNGKPDQIAPEGVKIHRHEICQTFYTSRLLTKKFLPESA